MGIEGGAVVDGGRADVVIGPYGVLKARRTSEARGAKRQRQRT